VAVVATGEGVDVIVAGGVVSEAGLGRRAAVTACGGDVTAEDAAAGAAGAGGEVVVTGVAAD